jgi:hypothetical protein
LTIHRVFWQYLCKNELDCELWTAGVLRSFFYDFTDKLVRLLMSLRNFNAAGREKLLTRRRKIGYHYYNILSSRKETRARGNTKLRGKGRN